MHNCITVSGVCACATPRDVCVESLGTYIPYYRQLVPLRPTLEEPRPRSFGLRPQWPAEYLPDCTMADESLYEKIHDLSDLELALLLCFIAKEHCLISTPPDDLDDLIQELQAVGIP